LPPYLQHRLAHLHPAGGSGRRVRRGSEIATRLGDRAALVRLLDAHTTYKTFFGQDFGELFTRTEQALKLADEIHDLGLRVALHARLAWVEILRAHPRAGMAIADRGIALADGDRDIGRDEAGYSPLVSLHTLRASFCCSWDASPKVDARSNVRSPSLERPATRIRYSSRSDNFRLTHTSSGMLPRHCRVSERRPTSRRGSAIAGGS